MSMAWRVAILVALMAAIAVAVALRPRTTPIPPIQPAPSTQAAPDADSQPAPLTQPAPGADTQPAPSAEPRALPRLLELGSDVHTEADKSDARYYFRPYKTILVRTVQDGGESFYIRGDHRQTIPALHRLVLDLQE